MKYTPPWRRPIWIIYFIGAISFSIWLAMPQDNATNEVNRIILRFRPFVNLFGMVAVGAFLGNIAEGRCWHLLLATMITSCFSNVKDTLPHNGYSIHIDPRSRRSHINR